ncbi:hypothetical protein [Aeromonas veronii]|uniref:hypothetical protein n=1 Tax=Aeromonas veronii TaxID=654 RepID=UPI001F0A694D|nr:hypothetical protein [Aeromonas veronii]
MTELDERAGALSEEEKARRDVLVSSINDAMRNVVLDEPPQYRELLESMLDRIGVIKIQGRYGMCSASPESEEYQEVEDRVREKIRAFPDLPLTPIDVVKKELQQRGHPVAEVSGRTASITPNAANPAMWDVNFHAKADAVANVAGFQNGKYDAIVITRPAPRASRCTPRIASRIPTFANATSSCCRRPPTSRSSCNGWGG